MTQLAVWLLLGASMLGQRPVHPQVARLFRSGRCDTPRGSIHYRLFVPRHHLRSSLPLVIWFHGRGEMGHDNTAQLAWLELIFAPSLVAREVNALVLACQFESYQDHVFEGGELHRGAFWRLDRVVQQVIDNHQVDADRIYLVGISQGASACWQFALRHPGRFAAMLPLATSEIPAEYTAEARWPAIWAFQSTGDGIRQCGRMQAVIAALGRFDQPARLTIVDSRSHDCWTSAFLDYGAWQWLLAQRRGAGSNSFVQAILGRDSDDWRRHALLLSGCLALPAVLLVAWWHWRHRPRRGSQLQSEEDV